MEEIKALRRNIGTIINSYPLIGIGDLDKSPGVPMVSDAIVASRASLDRARMWLGKVLGEMGSSPPYPASTDVMSPVIEPTADASDDVVGFGPLVGSVARIKSLRSFIQLIIDNHREQVETARPEITDKRRRSDIELYAQQWFVCMTEAKMWLGVELGRKRKETNKQL